jgi:DNA-binding response OmpR family regulator
MTKPLILIVEDDLNLLRLLKANLEREGFAIRTAENGKQALSVANKTLPGLVIADILMPEMDGWELCYRLRSEQRTSQVPFIFLTSRTEVPDRVRGLEIGADDYVTKPFSQKELVARIRRVIERSRPAGSEQTEAAISGSLGEMSLADLLQIFEHGGKSGTLLVIRERQGKILLQRGSVIDAQIDDLRGEEAVYRMFAMTDGRFEFRPEAVGGERTIHGTTQGLIFEGMRLLDESKRPPAE